MKIKDIPGVNKEKHTLLTKANITSLQHIVDSEPEDLVRIGFSRTEAEHIISFARNHIPASSVSVPTENIVLGIGVGVLCIIGIFFLVSFFSPTQEPLEYNGFLFENVQCGQRSCYATTVFTNVGVHPIAFYHSPWDVLDVPISYTAVQSILQLRGVSDAELVIAFDDGESLGKVGVALLQITRITGNQLYNIRTRAAVYGEDIYCSDSVGNRVVAYLFVGERDEIRMDNGCILLSAASEDSLMRVSDTLGLHLLEIMP